jgi:hypothetical protein
MTGKPHLTLVSLGLLQPRPRLTAARKLKYSWILARLSGVILKLAPNPHSMNALAA